MLRWSNTLNAGAEDLFHLRPGRAGDSISVGEAAPAVESEAQSTLPSWWLEERGPAAKRLKPRFFSARPWDILCT
jgi:hypothetical protein